ncbi:hypothetical protein SAMN06295924_107140 [Rathayibacter rathayi NCPPB 2980 = VKM Ac-1601]|nr:hypothetical protein FB469_0393 [Rathayibacter rathayi]SOE05166.1 hypothetical protein SAMN06295924_107140 [Rathayibacter rathayi NCPPB 2980 = VKM Ac-1601]
MSPCSMAAEAGAPVLVLGEMPIDELRTPEG